MDLQVYQWAPNTGIFYMTCIWLKSLKREFGVLVIQIAPDVLVTLKMPVFGALWYTCKSIVSKD
jgi:hypothetical protein